MKKITAFLLTVLVLVTATVSVFAADTAWIGGVENNIWISKYGNVYTDLDRDVFLGDMGFSYGDIVTVRFLSTSVDLPVVPDYSYVDSGAAAVIVKEEAGAKVALAVNMGNFAESYGIALKREGGEDGWYWEAAEGVELPVEVSFEMKEKEGYLAEYLLRQLVRTNEREDYAHLGDEDFANFRPIDTAGMGKGRIYRTSSPINPEIARNSYALNALEAAGVTVIVNLADSREEAESYEGFSDSYYAEQQVIYLNLDVNVTGEDFERGLTEALRFMIENKGVYAVHCNEGKDRAGYVSALLECFMGATYEQVIEDYMKTYENYYGVSVGSERYDAIARSNIVKSLSEVFEVEDLENADLKGEAEDYFISLGFSRKDLRTLRKNLSSDVDGEWETGAKIAVVTSVVVLAIGGTTFAAIYRRRGIIARCEKSKKNI